MSLPSLSGMNFLWLSRCSPLSVCLLRHELPIPSFVVVFWVLVVCFGGSCSSVHSLGFGLPRGSWSPSSAGGGGSLDSNQRLCWIRGPPCAASRGRPTKEAGRTPSSGTHHGTISCLQAAVVSKS